jgi:hypothetical protein
MIDPRSLVDQAYDRVDFAEWSTWTPDPQDPILMPRMVPEIPPLTGGIVQGFVGFRAWLEGRSPTAEEYRATEHRLGQAWLMWDREAATIRDVLASLLLRDELLGLPPEAREEIRVPLSEHLEERAAAARSALADSGGERSESTQAAGGSPEKQLAEEMTRSAMQHQLFLNTLNQMGMPPTPG